jgi:broad specificity phosphatase PhoE
MSAERASRAFTVYLARHSRSVWNAEGRVAGQQEAPISDVGRAQADNLASVLDGVRLHAVYSSPLARARETAQPTAARQALNVCVRSELRELHFGVLQGRYRDHRDPEARSQLELWRMNPLKNRLPGGESLADLDDRISRFLHDVLDVSRGSILIVGHRYVNSVILGRLLGWPASRWIQARPKCRYLFEIVHSDPPIARRISLGDRDLGRRRQFRT